MKWAGVIAILVMGTCFVQYSRIEISREPNMGPHFTFVGACIVAVGAFCAAISALAEFSGTPAGRRMQSVGLLVAFCGALTLAGAAAADAWPIPLCSELHEQDLKTMSPYAADRLDEIRREHGECLITD